MTFPDGVLGGHSSVKGFKVVATDGRAGRVSWASYAPGESYLVLTLGLLRRKHRVLPAGAVQSVGNGEVHVALSRSELEHLPLLADPRAAVDGEKAQNAVATFERRLAGFRSNRERGLHFGGSEAA